MCSTPCIRQRFVFLFLLFILLLSACGPSQYTPRAWIDFPRDGTVFEVVEPVTVVAHAALKEGIGYVALSVNSTPLDQQSPDPAGAVFADFKFQWTPPQEGDYTLELSLFDSSGKLQAAATSRVKFGDLRTFTPDFTFTPSLTATATLTETPQNTSTHTPTYTLTPSLTPTITQTPALPIRLKLVSDRSTVDLGECAVLSWWVQNADVAYLDGTEVAFTGEDGVCPTTTHTYLLRAERGSESAEETMTITVNTADTTPPDVPTQMVPANGLSAGCKSNQTLAWLPVSDPSGLRGYDVTVQRNVGGTWKNYQSFTSVEDKQINLNVECGYEYRWRVRATDNEGNTSAWSGWFTFVIVLP